jgi:hypothetical protein
MTRAVALASLLLGLILTVGIGYAALVVPTDIQQPGTQPSEVRNLESPDKCDNCHGGYNTTTEPAYNWRGSMMAQATRDPIFWATLAIAEQDFDGAGDLCLRCHTPEGWLGGRSTPTDGSGLMAGDTDGVACDLCHKLANPDDSEWIGTQFPPFVAHNGDVPAVGFYGSGMYVIWGDTDKLGPFTDATARHRSLPSRFHRQSELCGTCHDVSNPAVGDLAHNNGRQATSDPVTASGVPNAPVTTKAAFNNFPFQYGIVERTFSEHLSSALSATLVSSYDSLPADLKAGAIKTAYESALVAGRGGDYQDGTARYFTCQTCHLRPITGQGCNKNPAVRPDLPLHDMTGGNYWMPDAIKYLNDRGALRLGNGLSTTQLAALNDGKTRALKQLSEAASLSVTTDTVKIVNLTGHKLISGYPEGRRMWLNVKWYDSTGVLVREDGRYGTLTATVNGSPVQVSTILDLSGSNTRIYEAHYAMTQEWASQLIALGYPSSLPLTYDRQTGEPTHTLGGLAAQPPGTSQETFHFVLNNHVAKDNRIPPYGMSYEAARKRNALPVPVTQYGSPGPGGAFNYWGELALNPPATASYATIDLLYQPTSWEYIQFLSLANDGSDAFLAAEGANLLDAWLNTGMAEPYVMASATWGAPPQPPTISAIVDALSTWSVSRKGDLQAQTSTFSAGSTVAVVAHVADSSGGPLSGAQVFVEIRDPADGLVTTLQGFSDTGGDTVVKWNTARKQAAGTYTARVTQVVKSGYDFAPGDSIVSVAFLVQ